MLQRNMDITTFQMMTPLDMEPIRAAVCLVPRYPRIPPFPLNRVGTHVCSLSAALVLCLLWRQQISRAPNSHLP